VSRKAYDSRVRILQLVAGEKWTGPAAVVFDQTAALVSAGIEAQFGFIGDSPLARRLHPLGWARPLLTRPRGPGDYWRDVARLRATLVREKFDVVHTHGTLDLVLATLSIGATGARLVRTLPHLRQVRRGPLSAALLRRTDAFAFSNRSIAMKFGARGPVHSPVVDPERFNPQGERSALRPDDHGQDQRFVIGTVGKIAVGRGHEEALACLPPLESRAVLMHVGKGEHQPALQAKAAAMSIADRNLWVGYREEELPALYRAMDVFLFTASGSDQGQRAILEAMASGLPVVALDLPGVRDLVNEGEQGFVAKDVDGLASGLRRLMEASELRVRLGRRARMRALEFTAEKFAARAREFYEGLFEERSARTSRA
jgi:glycosyltransferase involved in cell wall biosynthesis